nr:hypothetical protein [Tanacetum cinerariifolium]
MSTDKESSAAGTDNCPPMLVESDYKSWKIRIKRYIRVQVTRDKTDKEFTEIENNRELSDIQATNILSQGLPRHKGSGKSLQQKKEELFDKYKQFRAIRNDSIHDYFVHFYKLINDMKITQLDIPAHQMNTKFVNNLPPYREKYVTNVKNNKDISATTYVELYTYLKSYEPHALKTLKKQEQSSSIVDPLAYLASTTHHLTPTQPTNPPPSISSLTLPPQPAAQSSNNAMLATMNQIIVTKTVQRKASGNVGNTGTRGTQSYGQVTDNKGKLVICYNCRGEGHVSRQCKEKKRVKDSQYFKDKMLLMEAKEKGAVLDAEAEAFLADVECTTPYDQPLAITTTNIFEVSHEDAYNSDVDEGPHEAAAFMAKLSSTSGTNDATTSHVNEVHIDDNQIFDNVNHLLAHEMHQEEHLDSNVKSDIDYNTIPYHQYQLDSEVQDVPTKVSSVSPGEISMITILDDLRNQLDGHLKSNLSQKVKSINSLKNKSKKVLSEKKDLKESLDENLVKEVTEFMRIFDELDKEYEQCVLKKKKLQIEKKNLLIQNECSIIDCIEKDIYSIVLASDRDRPLSEELHSNCVRENSKIIELEGTALRERRHYQEVANLDQPHEYVECRTHYRKITVSTAKNAKLNSESLSKMHSEPIVPEKPKAKCEKARIVEDHHRNLNKQNHVDSRLNVKRTGFVSNSNTVCNAWNESLVFANHDNCVEVLFDEYECFRAIRNESIHEYFICFHKLANDLKIAKINIPTHQQNTKFLNNLPSYWAKYVTSVKHNQDISTKSYVELYTYLKAYEPHALKTLKKQEQSSSSVDPLAYLAHSSKHQTFTIVASPTSTSSSTLAPEQQDQSGSDAMIATMQQLVNLLSGFQKQFPLTNNQLCTSSNPRSHATVHKGQIVTETVQRKAPGNVSNAGTKGNQGYGKKTYRNGKKVICHNCRGEVHVSRECKEPKRAKDTQYYKDKMMLSDAKDRGVILDAEAEAFLADVECTESYDKSLALTITTAFQVSHEDAYDFDIDDGPHDAVAFMANFSSTEEANGTSSRKINKVVVPPTEKPSETHYVSPGEMYLQDQITAIIPQLEGHIKTNKDLSRANESLKAELAQCKLEMQSLEHNKALNEKNNKVVSKKKDLDERNLKKIVCLQKANRVMSDLLKTYQQPTHNIPMLSKRPNIATSDLHKTALGSSNPKYGNIARESHPAIYDGNRLLDPTHVPSFVWETEETIALGAESRARMFEKPGTVKPINYDVLNNSYIKFVAQKELSREQVYWQSASAVKAPFVHTRPTKSEVFSLIRSLKLLFPCLDPIIFQHTKNKHASVSHECFNHTQQAVETQFLPFLNMFKKLVYQFEEVLVKEVKEFEKIFDELDDEYCWE